MRVEKDSPAAADVIDYLRRMQSSRCRHCERELCGHQLVINLLMGYKQQPICVACLCEHLGQDLAGFVDHAAAYIRQRECYRAGWSRANRDEGMDQPDPPACLLRIENADSGSAGKGRADGAATPWQADASGEPAGTERLDVRAEWDAGDLSCGDLVLELRLRMQPLDRGQLLRLTASDPSAKKDLPAWCRLTGNGLVRASHPVYWIRRGS